MSRRIAIALFLAALPLFAQPEPGTVPAAKDRLTDTDIYNIQYAQDPQISTD